MPVVTTPYNPMANPVGHIINDKPRLLNAIKAYTNAYNNYEGCNATSAIFGNGTPFIPTVSGGIAAVCPPITSTFTNNTNKFFDLSGNINSLTNNTNGGSYSLTDLSMNIHRVSADISGNIALLNTGVNTLSPDQIDQNYNSMVARRAGIDVELQNLYNIPDSVPNQYLKNIDSKAYTGVLWGVLATSLVYYIFTKI